MTNQPGAAGPGIAAPGIGARGFTLVELVTALVLLGLLAAVLLPRLPGLAGFAGKAARDQVVSGLRYAQQQAMSRNRPARFVFGGDRYRVEYRDSGGVWHRVPVPASGASAWSLPGGVRFAGSGRRQFESIGRAASGACGPGNEVNLTSGAAIAIECQTGFVHADG